MIYTKVNKCLCFQFNCLVGTKPSGLSHYDGPTFEQGGREEVEMAPNCCDSLGGPTSISTRLGKPSETGIPAFQGMAG